MSPAFGCDAAVGVGEVLPLAASQARFKKLRLQVSFEIHLPGILLFQSRRLYWFSWGFKRWSRQSLFFIPI